MKRSVIIIEIAILIAVLCSRAIFAAGELDTTFNMTGRVSVPFGVSDDVIERLTTQIDGKIVCAGYTKNSAGNYDIAVLRLNPGGTLDTGFNGSGKLLKSIGPGDDLALGLAIQPDGKILIGGTTFNGDDDDIVVIRLNPDGSADKTFGTAGIVTTSVRGYDRGFALALQYDGKIVMAGFTYSAKGDGMIVVRYNANGSLDTGFGASGIVEDFGDVWEFAVRDIKIGPDGRIVIAGSGYNDSSLINVFAIAKYLPDGSPDVAFGSGGKVFTLVRSVFNTGSSAAMQEDGKVVVGGGSSDSKEKSDYTTLRYLSDGSLDPAYGSGGSVVTILSNHMDFGSAVLVQPDGRIVLAGAYNDGPSDYLNFGIVRYDAAGGRDMSFGSNGLASLDWDHGIDLVTAADLQVDGKILVAGNSSTLSGERKFVMARLLGDSPVPPAAAVSGQITDSHGVGIGGAKVTISNLQSGQVRTLLTNPFGYFAFQQLQTDNYYQVRVSSKGRRFVTPRTFRLLGNINGLTIPSDAD